MMYWVTKGPIQVAVPGRDVPKAELTTVLEGRCMCGGDLDRAAFRDRGTTTRQWRAFGYRCFSCGTIYTEPVL